MDYEQIRAIMATRSITGYFLQVLPISLITGLIYALCRYVFLKRKKREIKWGKEAFYLVFVCYLTGLFNLILTPGNFWLTVFDGLFLGEWRSPGRFFRYAEIIRVPFIVRYIRGEAAATSWAVRMLVGNYAMFIPLGFGLPFITKKVNIKNIFLIAVLTPVAVELLQFIPGRSLDVDDLICNSLGILTGFFIAYPFIRSKKSD
ncbi:MAG: VanZ family protein [Clostridia bacterium]|nr:VanZ family protein [Clostridia bacterium]